MSKCETCGGLANVRISRVEAGNTRVVYLCERCSNEEMKASYKGKLAADLMEKEQETARGIKAERTESLKKAVAFRETLNANRHYIHIRVRFSASHQLRMYDGSVEPLHEHEWRVKVTVSGALDSIGVVMDFHELEKRLEDIIGPMRGRSLNELPPFASRNPSAENVAAWIATSVSVPETARVASVEVWETPENSAQFVPLLSIDSCRIEK
ncbi:MAG TPA: 6-carboxytetrahydropterin synthase [Tepidisphaeraceae bacterium]|nr:6-carboxytetrahydropterin synthase [Tepidisphaeraceae bacterium]